MQILSLMELSFSTQRLFCVSGHHSPIFFYLNFRTTVHILFLKVKKRQLCLKKTITFDTKASKEEEPWKWLVWATWQSSMSRRHGEAADAQGHGSFFMSEFSVRAKEIRKLWCSLQNKINLPSFTWQGAMVKAEGASICWALIQPLRSRKTNMPDWAHLGEAALTDQWYIQEGGWVTGWAFGWSSPQLFPRSDTSQDRQDPWNTSQWIYFCNPLTLQ